MLLTILLFGASLPLMIFMCGVMIVKYPKTLKKNIVFYSVTIALIAYGINPNYENDLIRYFNQMESAVSIPFENALTWANDGLFVKNFLFWIIAKIGDFHILPAISMGVLYGVAAYIAVDSSEDIKCIWKVILFQLFMLPFYLATENVRNMLAFACVVLAAYRDVVKEKRGILTILLYILPCFIHVSGVVLVIVRFGIPFFKNHPKILVCLMAFLPAATLGITSILQGLSFKGYTGAVIKLVISKARQYTLVSESAYALRMLESGLYNSCRAVMFITGVCFVIITIAYFKYQKENQRMRKFVVFSLIICMITIIWIIARIVKYWVFGVAFIISCTPVLNYFMGNKSRCPKSVRICILIMYTMALCEFGLEIYRMESRVYWGDFWKNLLTNNIYFIFYNIIKGIMAAF